MVGPWAVVYSPLATYRAKWVERLVEWAGQRLVNGQHGLFPGLELDWESLVLVAQSSGSHVAVQYLTNADSCSHVKAMVLLSPVDGVDPFGIINEV